MKEKFSCHTHLRGLTLRSQLRSVAQKWLFLLFLCSVLSFGDPHIKKLDGGNYTFNGIGEYTIVNADNGTFLLQARTQVAPGELSKATIFTAGVAKENKSATVEVKLKSGGWDLVRKESLNHRPLHASALFLGQPKWRIFVFFCENQFKSALCAYEDSCC